MRVLDLTWAMAGPFCTLVLALLGAEVIKIETRASMDAMRRGTYARSQDPEQSPAFNSLNLNKLGLLLNLKHRQGLQLFQELAAVSDVVVENFRPGVLQRIGIGYDVLQRANPSIIVASSSAFGAAGPEAERPGYASIFSAMSSLGHLTGYIDGPPAELRDSVDLRAGAALAYAILAALHHRQRTGQGQYIDVSSREAIISLIGYTISGYGLNGQVPARIGNRDHVLSPHGVYPCLGDDQWITIAVDGDASFRALCAVMTRPDLASDRRYADAYRRLRNAQTLDEHVARWTSTQEARQAARSLQEVGVAAFPVLSSRDIACDQHLMARGLWHEVQHPKLGAQRVQGLPWRACPDWTQVQRAGPLMGQDTVHVVQNVLGLSKEDVVQLEQLGVFQ